MVGFNLAPVNVEHLRRRAGFRFPGTRYCSSFIGTTYSSNGQTTLRACRSLGRAPFRCGMGQSTNLSDYVVGQSGGDENVTLNVDPACSTRARRQPAPLRGQRRNRWTTPSRIQQAVPRARRTTHRWAPPNARVDWRKPARTTTSRIPRDRLGSSRCSDLASRVGATDRAAHRDGGRRAVPARFLRLHPFQRRRLGRAKYVRRFIEQQFDARRTNTTTTFPAPRARTNHRRRRSRSSGSRCTWPRGAA